MAMDWWKNKLIYQIYPRSFCDSNGDGIGDIPGIISKLDYLQALGVDLLWLSPLYPSPNYDNGYDISDYCAIHPDFGTLSDFDRLLSEAKQRGIGLLMDLVINHTSTAHQWFEKSRRREEPYTDFYIWRPGKGNQKPNKWSGFFGGDTWTYDPVRGEYYLHLFAKEQADLNYQNPLVIDAVKQVMKFWLDRGVRGFRCDVINILYKESLDDGRFRPVLRGSEYYLSRPGLHTILKDFHQSVWKDYEAYTVGETVFVTPQEAQLLTDEKRGELCSVFAFEHMETDCFGVKWFPRPFRPSRFFKVLEKWQTALPWTTLYFENHDQPRALSRFGSEAYPEPSAKALALLLLSLRGTPFVYQGQEIGMRNFDFTSMDQVQDVESRNVWALARRLHLPSGLFWKVMKAKSRDNARTPMQWTGGKNAGFSDGTPWLGIHHAYPEVNVEREEQDPKSILSFYRRLIAFRRKSPVLQTGTFERLYQKGPVWAFRRSLEGADPALILVINLSDKKTRSPFHGPVLFSSYEKDHLRRTLRPYEAVLMEETQAREEG